MNYTLGDAAKATGKSKTTIAKAIKNGRISAKKLDNGSYQIDPSELHRVYPMTHDKTVENGQYKTLEITPINSHNNSDLLTRLQLAEARLSDKDDIIGDLREDRDKWRQQATALLDHKKETKGLWVKLLGK